MSSCGHTTVRGENGRLVCISCDTKLKTRGNKYKAERHRGYASKHEADISAKLHALQSAGKISDLEEQVRFGLIPADDLGPALAYIADFTFIDRGAGYGLLNSLVVMDAKGVRTPVYRLKCRLMYFFHGITITEV